MTVEHVIRLIVIAIVLLVAFSLLGFILKVGSMLLGLGVRILLVLLVIAIILRIFEVVRSRR
ncbi:MAG: hypothetical protein AAF752_14945 [Bacteroidota bacterium]